MLNRCAYSKNQKLQREVLRPVRARKTILDAEGRRRNPPEEETQGGVDSLEKV
jgi:hypothetical protein